MSISRANLLSVTLDAELLGELLTEAWELGHRTGSCSGPTNSSRELLRATASSGAARAAFRDPEAATLVAGTGERTRRTRAAPPRAGTNRSHRHSAGGGRRLH